MATAPRADEAMMTQLTDAQRTTGEVIESIIRNFKKDSSSRKTISYYEERLRRLDAAWVEFEATDNKIRCLQSVPLDHKYFTDGYYDQISQLTTKYREIFQASMESTPSDTNQQNTIDKTTSSITDNTAALPTINSTTSAIRRQKVMMSSLKRLLIIDPSAANLNLKEQLWGQIQELHFSIWESSNDPLREGYDMDAYIDLEKTVFESFRMSSRIPEHGSEAIQNNSLPLPKITIPKFSGDYIKWTPFFDLFSQLVDSQQIPTAQKMWYLKSTLGGEAEKLISHLSATAENYAIAWKLLQERYNNQRVIVATLIKQLLDQPTAAPSDASIKQLHDTTQECLHALKNSGIDTTSWDPILLHILVKKLDRASHMLYERSIMNPKELQKVDHFLTFLEQHFYTMETMSHKEKSLKVCASASSDKHATCPCCKNELHQLYRCQKFKQLTPSLRLDYTQKHGLCVNCLKSGHSAKNCMARSCPKCNKRHNSLLHLEHRIQTLEKIGPQTTSSAAATPRTKNNKTEPAQPTTGAPEAASLAAANMQPSTSYVLLGTSLVKIKAGGIEVECRALLDSGSQVNLITERLVKRLNISKQASSININGIGNTNTKTQHRVNVGLHSRINGFSTRLEALVLPRIIAPQPSQFLNIDDWPLPNNIMLADPTFNRSDKIDLLLGAEHYHQLLAIGQIKLSEELPILQNSVFGWIVAGKIHGERITNAVCGICTEDENLEASIARLWELDEIGTTEKSLSAAERKCEEHFAQNTVRNHQNRFQVKIPFHQNPDTLGESHGIALNRFLALERRLQKNPELKDQYTNFMDEYEAMGHMTKADAESITSPNYYIPHHCVLRPESSTTKLRVVFDASTKTSSGYSLNDLMYAGPTIQSELFSILLRFRMPRFVFTTDIEKMYRQILVAPEDRQLQLIIWRRDSTRPITYYKLNTVTYGTRAAPYLATKCLQQLAKENTTKYPLASQFLTENFYVDDGLGGCDSLVTTMHLQEQLVQIMKAGGFTLRKWCANHPQLLRNIPREELEVNLDFQSTRIETIKTLGLVWLPKDDKLGIKVNVENIKRVTKRTVTSDLARLFDPLGILSPIVVTAKMFIQELWELKLDWDQSLPESLHTRWITFRTDLDALRSLQVSRHIFKGRVPDSFQLHIFTDASERAYGAAAYIRSVFKDGTIMTRLLCAKTRVAPLKKQTIPRLELCAAALGAQLATRIKADLHLTSPVWFWTDSEIVLSWLNSSSSLFNTFVANRISLIQEATQAEQWRHVSSRCNPADVLSRGMSPTALKECSLWFYGPPFLHGKEEIWPPRFNSKLSSPTNLEKKRRFQESLGITTEDPTFVYSINHKNSFHRLQRIVAYMLRFIAHTRCQGQMRQPSRLLTAAELKQALVPIIAQMQLSEFKEELMHLRKYNELPGTSIIRNLTPFLDANGLIRVGGRLGASPLEYDSKHQLLIPYNDPISKLIFQTAHADHKHCSPQALLGIVRQRFWPIKGKILARATVHRCITCSKAKPKLFNQIMGDLPSTRVTPARPFVNAGVDYCGPITVHYKLRGKRPHKAYIAVFCCFATKAVHLELVSDLTTDAFIGALKRFIARRGYCQNLYCDNATNFVGAKNKLPELSTIIHSPEAQEAITNDCSKKGIQFNFIPPRAPHFGGLWEAAVKSAKYLLTRTVGNASLTYEELETIVIEIEAILNSRPISPMSNDPNDISALTPGHFLIGEPLTAQIDAQARPEKVTLETRWNLVSRIKHEFWKRWSRDYLNELQCRTKWRERSKNLSPGAIVIIKEDNIPVMKWPLGRVIKTYKGDDEIVRVADVQTASGVLKRAVQYLAPLPKLDDEAEPQPKLQKQFATSRENADVVTDKHHPSSAPDESSRGKRRRISTSPIVTAMLIGLLILPFAAAESIEITKFDPNIGIHFEGLGSARMSRSEWKIITYYELQPYWHEMTTLISGVTALHNLCNRLTPRETCMNVLQPIELSLRDLKDENKLLKGRVKRGAVNVVGNIANSLFGVLDSNYAEEMSTTINTIKENEHHLKRLLMNQTSIIDATLNVFKQDELRIKQNLASLDENLTNIVSRLVNDEKVQHQTELFKVFISLSVQLSVISAKLHRVQSAIVAALSDSHHGKISPMLLSPSQLQAELVQVRNHLPASLRLPVDEDNILQLYKIMSVKGGVTDEHVIFHISIPLSDPETFELLKPHPIPALINDTMLAIRPCSDYLAITAHKDQYFVLNEKQWNSCLTLKAGEFLCSPMQTTLNANAEKCSCELSLLTHNTRIHCNIIPAMDTMPLAPLEHSNQWLYTMQQSTRISAVCGQQHSQLNLKGSGLIKINPDCTLKLNSVTIQGHQTFLTPLHASYTATTNLSDITYPHEVQFGNLHIKSYADQIKNISEIQDKLHQQVLTTFPSEIKHIKYHHATIAYAALVLAIIATTTMIYKKTCERKIKVAPVPAVRQQLPPSDFEVSVT